MDLSFCTMLRKHLNQILTLPATLINLHVLTDVGQLHIHVVQIGLLLLGYLSIGNLLLDLF